MQIIILTNLAINKVAYRYFRNSKEKWSHFLRSLKTSDDFMISRLWDARMWYQSMDHRVDWIHGPSLWMGTWTTPVDRVHGLTCGPSPWSTLWTGSIENPVVPVHRPPCGPPLIFKIKLYLSV